MNISQLILQSDLPIREISQEEVKKVRLIYLEILNDILFVCDKHNLTPMLGGGSCLGAIRHKGFIPWDDDLDLIMLRNDYDKLPNILLEEFGNKYQFIGANVSSDPKYPYMKVQRPDCFTQSIYQSDKEYDYLGIDIFPIDNIPSNHIKRLWHGFWLNTVQYLALCIHFYKEKDCYATQLLRSSKEGKMTVNHRLFIGKIASKLFDEGKLYVFFDRFAAKYKNTETGLLGIPTGREHYFGEIHTPSVYLPICYGEFEGIKVPLPHDYDRYLSTLYGNYMSIPPIEKRERHYIVNIHIPE